MIAMGTRIPRKGSATLLSCFALALIGTKLSACSESASGTYVGKATNGAFLVQLVQADKGQLTGRYEELLLQSNGQTQDVNATLAGQIDGKTVVATMKPSELFSSGLALSGTLENGHLHLSGGANGQTLIRDLQRSDESNFRKQVANLNGQAAKIVSERARIEAAQKEAQLEADRLKKLQALTNRLTSGVAKIDVGLPAIEAGKQSYRNSTERMQRGLSREQAMAGSGQAAVARGQISVAINQLAIETDQAHQTASNAYQTFSTNYGQLLPQIQEFEKLCADSHASAALTAADQQNWNAACTAFITADKAFQDRASAVKAAFADLESAWTSERAQQEQIVQQSNRSVG